MTEPTGPGDGPVLQSARADDLLERHLAGIMLAIGIAEAAAVVHSVLVLPPPANLVMPLVQGVVAVLALWGWLRLRRHQATHADAQRIIAIGLLLIGLMMPLEQSLTGHGLLAANLGLILVAAGGLIVSTRDYVIVVGLSLAAWAGAVATGSAWQPTVADQATLLVGAVFVGSVLHAIRVSGRRTLSQALDFAVRSALRDDLTGLWNRRGAREASRSLVGRARHDHAEVWCMFFDVRGLKSVNDRLGHAQGDRLLEGIGKVLNNLADTGVLAVRWGGDEFFLLGEGEQPDVAEMAASLKRSVEERIGVIDQRWEISPGVSHAPVTDDPDLVDRLVHEADEDMYRRRALGGSPQV